MSCSFFVEYCAVENIQSEQGVTGNRVLARSLLCPTCKTSSFSLFVKAFENSEYRA